MKAGITSTQKLIRIYNFKKESKMSEKNKDVGSTKEIKEEMFPYNILASDDINEIFVIMNEYVKKGYVPVGGISINPNRKPPSRLRKFIGRFIKFKVDNSKQVFYQAMVRTNGKKS